MGERTHRAAGAHAARAAHAELTPCGWPAARGGQFLGKIDVTYVMSAKKNSREASITSYVLDGPAGTVSVDGPTVPKEYAEQVRSIGFTKMTVTLK